MLAVDDAGRDRVDVDAVLDQVEPGRLGQRDDRGLGGAVDGDQRLAAPAGLARHVDDLAALAARDHRARRRLQREQRAGDVDREEPVVARPRDLDDRREVEQRGVVDQDVDAAGLAPRPP